MLRSNLLEFWRYIISLQELIAPLHVVFFDRDWKEIGTKIGLRGEISALTGIGSDVLETNYKPERYCVGTKMSWTSKRETTRREDMAYSLLGLFGVNMPMLYGEGDRAFTRLQQEIIKSTNDVTILLWYWREQHGNMLVGPLATAPHDFEYFRDLDPEPWTNTNAVLDVTNRGILVEARHIPEVTEHFTAPGHALFFVLNYELRDAKGNQSTIGV